MEEVDETKPYRLRLKQLDDEFESKDWKAHYRELAEYFLPRSSRYLVDDSTEGDNRGDKRNDKIFNGSTCNALRVLSAGMQGGLTSPAIPWFKLVVADKALSKIPAVQIWLSDQRDRMLDIYQKSNFYGSMYSEYEELAVFGTHAMLIEEDFDTVVRFRPLTAGEYRLAVDSSQRPDTLYRKFSLTARQMEDRFGFENMSEAAQDAYRDNRGEDRFKIVQAIQPNKKRDPASKGVDGMEFESVYFEEKTTGKVLSRGGYKSIPFAAPRWLVTASDTYGRSPAMDALPDAKMLQAVEKKALKGFSKQIDPPMNAPTSMKRSGTPNILPGGVNFVDVAQGAQTLAPTQNVSMNIQMVQFWVDTVVKRIERFFFNDMFLAALNEDKAMTALEVSSRNQEKRLLLGAVVDRIQTEILDVIIGRTYSIMQDRGLIDPMPEELLDAEIKIEYTSSIAQAQKAVGTVVMEQLIGFVGGISAADPSVLDKIDFDEAANQYAVSIGVPPRVVRGEEEVDEIRRQRANQQQMAQMSEMASQSAQTAQVLSETTMDNNSVLDSMARAF